jgi:hypothetical protein
MTYFYELGMTMSLFTIFMSFFVLSDLIRNPKDRPFLYLQLIRGILYKAAKNFELFLKMQNQN